MPVLSPMGMADLAMQPPMSPARRPADVEALRHVITQWNANRLDLFALSMPNENMDFNGVIRFYFQYQDSGTGQKVATKCIRVSSNDTTKSIIEVLIEKFRPDMKMLEVPEYALYEIHESSERCLNFDERPLLVQLNWHKDDREGRFLLRRIDDPTLSTTGGVSSTTSSVTKEPETFNRKLSKREKKELKKQEKINKQREKEESVAEKLYTEVPDTSFTRSISNPEAVMRRRRQQKLERKLQQFRSKDGGPDTGGTLKIYGESLCKEVPYKTLLLSVRDSALYVVEEMLDKYGRDRREAVGYCLVQCTTEQTVTGDRPGPPTGREYILDDDECPLAILMNTQPTRGSITFHVRPKPGDMYSRKRKKKPLNSIIDSDMPVLIEMHPDGSEMRRFPLLPPVTELGADPATAGPGGVPGAHCLPLGPAPYLYPRHCILAYTDGGIVTITPASREAETFINNQRIVEPTIVQHGFVVRLGQAKILRFVDPSMVQRERALMQQHQASSVTLPDPHEMRNAAAAAGNYAFFGPMPTPQQQQQQQQQQQMQMQMQGHPAPPHMNGRDNILPAVLEFREETEEAFFDAITLSLDVNNVQFKLAPTYTLYMATRFRASTHYRPELVPEERAVRLTEMLNQVSDRIFATVQMTTEEEHQQLKQQRLAFWMANSSEMLHFLKSDRHITSFSLQAQDILAETVHMAFKGLVTSLQEILDRGMAQMLQDTDDDSIPGIMNVLGAAMTLLRKCRVNAALTIQLFSQLFHFVNMWTFNEIVAGSSYNFCTHRWGLRIKKRLSRIETWAERQGLELAADCHLARLAQAAHLLLARKNTADDIASVSSSCFKLNSLQLRALLDRYMPGPSEAPISAHMVETIVRVAINTVDESAAAEGRPVRLEEDYVLQLPFLLPEDGYSCDVVRGVPGGLIEFVTPLQQLALCVMTPQPTSSGFWTIYMDRPEDSLAQSPMPPGSPSEMSYSGQSQHHQSAMGEPEVQVIRLHKMSGGMGLSIVAAKGPGRDRLGIYIKAVVEGGAAHHDGRLHAGDQLLSVDGASLVGITQESAADIMKRTGKIVELEVAKQGAFFHGLSALLSQPSPMLSRANSSGQVMHGHHPIDPMRMRLTQTKSMPALYPDQPTYQNQVPARATPMQQLPPQHNTMPMPQQQRSSSIQHINDSHRSGTYPMPAHSASAQQQMLDEHNFYQNVGHPNGHFLPPSIPQGLRPAFHEMPQHNGGRASAVLSEDELYHASPRIVGTPMASAGGPLVSPGGGPEKPQRQYAYEMMQPAPMKPHPTQMQKEVHFQEFKQPQHNGHHHGNGTATSNRVRFQEPTGVRFQEPTEERNHVQMSNNLEQLRISNNVEKEFKKRAAEFRDGSGSESESHPMSHHHPPTSILSNRANKQQQMELRQRELEAATLEEERILREADSRRRVLKQQSHSPSPPPPPLPSMPPPAETPPPQGATHRLDMLLSSNNAPKPDSTPTKRVSFMNADAAYEEEEEEDFERIANNSANDEKINRLEMARADPNAFIDEAENLLNSSSMTFERMDFSKSTGHTPSVIGTQEVYRDPRMKRLLKAQEEKATTKKPDGANLTFREKMRLFAVEAGESTPKDKSKISKAQREIDELDQPHQTIISN